MRIEIPNKYKLPVRILKHKILIAASQYIALCGLDADEVRINNYLIDKYNIQLKKMCYYLIMEASFQANGSESVIILFKDKSLDKLARTITYGNGQINGCSILKKALSILK